MQLVQEKKTLTAVIVEGVKVEPPLLYQPAAMASRKRGGSGLE
jgi:hypothetical protein